MTEAAETQIKVQILGKTPQYLEKLSQSMSLGLSQEEMIMLQNYFKGIGRDPTDVEMQAMAQAWSEHCCYKSSKFYLRKYFGGLENMMPFSQWRMMQEWSHSMMIMPMS